jgi:hypothetical protein
MVAAQSRLVEKIEGALGEEIARQIGFHGAALVPGPDRITGHGAGTTGNNEERAYETVQHVVPPRTESGKSLTLLKSAGCQIT